MKQYLDLLKDVMENGTDSPDRTGTGKRSVFGRQMRFNLQEGFPLVTTKKVPFKAVAHELLWFLSGSTNTKYLEDNGVTIWREWQDEKGNLGPIYSHQWTKWTGLNGSAINQIDNLVRGIRHNPFDRGHIVTAWNPAELYLMALRPCHCLFQCHVRGGSLDLQVYVRSNDLFLGCPFNIASYALLLTMLAQQTGYEPGELVYTTGDAHIYRNHFDQVKEQLSRASRDLPALIVQKASSVFDYRIGDFDLLGYDPWPAIKAEVAV